MYRRFAYRIYPSKVQEERLEALLEIARTFYNAGLQERRDAWRKQHISLSCYDQCKQLKEIRTINPEYALLNFTATEGILRRVDRTFKEFFERIKRGEEKVGYPRFKSRTRFSSIIFPAYGDGIKLRDNRLYVMNVGEVKIKLHRPIGGKIKTVTIKRQCGKWYAVFANIVEIEPLPVTDRQVGIDIGLTSFAVTSDNDTIENPRYLRESEAILKNANRKVTRRKKGGHNRRKAVRLLAKHQKVRNQRKDFAHKLARNIVNVYGYIAVEDLKIENMVQNHYLAKSISDAGWGQFLDFLEYNGTSQRCSNCGTIVPKTLKVRIHRCPNCGLVIPRDYNSALDILRLGRSLWDITCINRQSVSQETIAVTS